MGSDDASYSNYNYDLKIIVVEPPCVAVSFFRMTQSVGLVLRTYVESKCVFLSEDGGK